MSFVLKLSFVFALSISIAFTSRAETNFKFIPLPIYATSPNEGDTVGFMPVVLLVDAKTARTKSIFAPSVSYNGLIYTTGTFRWFHYPTEDSSFTFVPSYSSHINKNLKIEFIKRPLASARFTTEALFYPRRSIFERYFGLGPLSKRNSESSYTKTGGELRLREGFNISENFNVGAKLFASRWLVEPIGIPNKPLTREAFPNDPGMMGASTLGQGISLRYDARPQREYSEQGWFTELNASYVEGLSGSDDFGKFEWETKGMWRELNWLSGAARGYWTYTPGSSRTPFYEQASLGGEYRFRGFNGGRFYDRGAWELEFEQRVTYLRTRIYGVQAEWRVDPFFSIGQVYSDSGQMFRDIKMAGGLGFRAWVRPNVVGRVDLGTGGDGLKIYVELGYPY